MDCWRINITAATTLGVGALGSFENSIGAGQKKLAPRPWAQRRTSSRIVLRGALLSLCLVAPAAHAAQIAVVPLGASGKNARGVAESATRQIAELIRRDTEHRLVMISRGRTQKLRHCLQAPRCTRRIAGKYRARYLVTGYATAMGSKTHVDLRVISDEGVVVGSTALFDRQQTRLAYRVGESARQLIRNAVERMGTPSAPPQPADMQFAPEEIRHSDRGAANPGAANNDADNESPDYVSPRQPDLSAAARPPISPAKRDSGPLISQLWTKRYWIAWSTAGAGIASLATGVAFGAVSAQATNSARDEPNQVRAWALRDKARKNAFAANLLFGIGGAATLTSVLLFYLERREQRRESQAAVPRRAVHVSTNGTSLIIGGSF
jgi:hypothetical protein